MREIGGLVNFHDDAGVPFSPRGVKVTHAWHEEAAMVCVRPAQQKQNTQLGRSSRDTVDTARGG